MRKIGASPITTLVIDGFAATRHPTVMLGTRELLERLDARKIVRAEIARVINVAPARVTEMFKGARAIKLDEAKRLVEHYGLDEDDPITALSEPVSRLLVLHVARALKAHVSPEDQRVEELAQDLRAFSRFASDRQDEVSSDMASGFLRGRQPEPPRLRQASRT